MVDIIIIIIIIFINIIVVVVVVMIIIVIFINPSVYQTGRYVVSIGQQQYFVFLWSRKFELPINFMFIFTCDIFKDIYL